MPVVSHELPGAMGGWGGGVGRTVLLVLGKGLCHANPACGPHILESRPQG